MNVGVPGRLSLVGYDNSYLSRLRSIWLTSVDSGGFGAGRLAARTLMARVADPSRPAELHLLSPTLQVRGSTAPPPAAECSAPTSLVAHTRPRPQSDHTSISPTIYSNKIADRPY